MKKVIIFDVDGVITDSGDNKEAIIQKILEDNNLFGIQWVSDIFWIGLNRILLLDKIYEIQAFDKQKVLQEINAQLFIQESKVELIETTFEFIKKYYKEYDFFTNTSLPKKSLNTIVQKFDISEYFLEFLSYDDGSKKENIEYIMQVHRVSPENILFIDDKMSHINTVKDTGVRTLLFKQDGVSLESKINTVFK